MSKKSFVSPYDVQGQINYSKLIDKFGVKKVDSKILDRIHKIAGEVHPFLKRGIFFAHRDLENFLDEYERGNKGFLYTGRAPSGPIHLGHVGVWVFLKWLQEKLDLDIWFQFPDEEKYLFKQNANWEEIQNWTKENMLDVIALGFDPKKTNFLVDTKHAGIMYPEAVKVAKKITFSSIKAAFGFNETNNIGSIFYTAMQTVPVFLPNVLSGLEGKKEKPCLIPLGIDQDVHFRLSRDVVQKLGHKKPSIIHSKFMPPLTGVEGKMSSSDSRKAILMTDTPKEVAKKINKYAFSGGRETIEEHRKKGGNVDIDVACQWLKYFEPSDEKLEKIYDEYAQGKILSGEVKKILIEKINSFLKDHQERRKKASSQIEKFMFKV